MTALGYGIFIVIVFAVSVLCISLFVEMVRQELCPILCICVFLGLCYLIGSACKYFGGCP